MTPSTKTRSVYSAICRSNGFVLVRARATIGSRFSLSESRASDLFYQSAAVLPTFGSVIGAILPLRRRLAAAIERTRNPIALAAAAFSRGQREIQNFCRRFGSGKPSFLRIPFVDHCSEATNSITETFGLAPVQFLSSVPINHAHKKAWRRQHDVQRNPA